MKTKTFERKKLSLRKTTVVNLNNGEMTVVRGGGDAIPIILTVYTCAGSCSDGGPTCHPTICKLDKAL